MEATISNCKISHSSAPPLISQTMNYSVVTKLSPIQGNLKGCKSRKLLQSGQHGCGWAMCCDKSGDTSLKELEAKIKTERNLDFGIEEKCQGKSSGIVELMECLESEAIMGEDRVKEASDYNRRAQIFDKSAQVFQALKEETKEHPNHT